jgi:acyl-CoA oxidase
LIGCVRDRAKGKKLPDGVGYLNHVPGILTKTCSYSDLSDLSAIVEAFDVTTANFAVNAAKEYRELLSKGLSEDDAQLKCCVQKSAAAKLHCHGYLFHRFRDACNKAPNSLKPVLEDLCKLYGLSTIKENAGSFLQCGYFKPAQMGDLDSKILELFAKLRPQLVPLTDSLGLTDYAINSPLGSYDGDVYRRMFERVTHCNPYKKHPYFEEVIKPVLLRTDPVIEKIEMKE